jgi:ParB family chromosome partitioning protein
MLIKDKKKVVEVAVDAIAPNPAQPRRIFGEKELRALSASIRVNGLLQPVVVRRNGTGYELVAGERRLRACKLAGLDRIPCIVSEYSDYKSAVLSLTENLHRQDLHFFEEAEGIKHLIDVWGITQEEAAYRLGRSQPAIANKLRLLRLSEAERGLITEAGLTERHARAFLRINTSPERMKAIETVIKKEMNVRQTEQLVDDINDKKHDMSKQKNTPVIKDVRIFFNTIAHAVKTMQLGGIDAQTLNSETDEYIECIVRIPKAKADAGGKKPA